MAIPDKNDIVHQRDENNELIPQVVELETASNSAKKFLDIPEDEPLEMKMQPAKQGRIAEVMQTAQDQEEKQEDEEDVTSVEIEFFCEKVIEPDLQPEDMGYVQTQEVVGAGLIALMSISTGTPQEDVAEAIEEGLEDEDPEELFQEDSEDSEAKDGEEEEESGEGSEEDTE